MSEKSLRFCSKVISDVMGDQIGQLTALVSECITEGEAVLSACARCHFSAIEVNYNDVTSADELGMTLITGE